jgi:hypothetical protein
MRDAPKVSGSYRSLHRGTRPGVALLRDARRIVLEIGTPPPLIPNSFQLEIVDHRKRSHSSDR